MNNTANIRRPNGSHYPEGIYLDMGTKQRAPAINNPYVRNHSVPVTIRRYFTDPNGTIVDKNIVPLALQVEYPVFVLGEFDRQGGYAAGLKCLAPQPSTKYLLSFVYGFGFIPQMIVGGFSGVANIVGALSVGDIVHVYTDDLQAPNYFIWIVQRFNQGSVASIVANSKTTQKDGLLDSLNFLSFKYSYDNVRQFDVPFHFVRLTNITTYTDNQVQPSMFKDPYVEQPDFLEITTEFNFDQYLGIAVNMLFETDVIHMNFKLVQ